MNVENVRKLRDFIAELPTHKFDMTFWMTSAKCGTFGCIAGWGAEIFGVPHYEGVKVHPEFIRAVDYYVQKVGVEKLGLSWRNAYLLFAPSNLPNRWRTEAVAVLNDLIETGKVAWPDNA